MKARKSKDKILISIILLSTLLGLTYFLIMAFNFKSSHTNSELTNEAKQIITVSLSDFYPSLVAELPKINVVYEKMDVGGYMRPETISQDETNTIYINEEFEKETPVLTAMIMIHEVTHVLQYKRDKNPDCIKSEINAFAPMAYAYFFLDKEDQNTLIENAQKYRDPMSSFIVKMAIIVNDAIKSCGKDNNTCWLPQINEEISHEVKSFKTYQELCHLNGN